MNAYSTEPISNTKIGTRMATATMPPTEMCFAFESSRGVTLENLEEMGDEQ